MKHLNYEAEICCQNNAWAKFFFQADSAILAKDHIAKLVNDNTLIGFDWTKHPDQIYYISYKKKGNQKSKFIYSNVPFSKKEKPDPVLGDYIRENHALITILKEVSDAWRSYPEYDLNPIQKKALKSVDNMLISINSKQSLNK